MPSEANKLLEQAKQLEQSGSFWESGEEYKNALLEFNKQSGFKDEKALCKKKIREMNLKRSEDFQEVAVQHQFSEDEIKQLEQFIDYCVGTDTLSDALKRIGIHPNFYPKYSEVFESSQHNIPITFLIATLSSQDPQGNLERDGHDGAAMNFAQRYGIQQSFITSLYLKPTLQKLMDTKMNFEDLSSYFKSTKLFTENMLKTFDVGLERFTAHDYVSSMHILAPLFEKTFMDLTEAIGGADTVGASAQTESSDQVWTQDRTLGENFLKDDKVREIWPEALHGDEVILEIDLLKRKALKEVKFENEKRALETICAELPNGEEIVQLWLRFEHSDDPAAKFGRQLDKYQAVEKALEYEQSQGIILFESFLGHALNFIDHKVLLERIEQLKIRWAAGQ